MFLLLISDRWTFARLDEYVTPSLYTGSIPLQTEQMLNTKSNNPATLLHVVVKGVLSDFKDNYKLVTFEPQEQLDAESAGSKSAKWGH